jgi:hypothetical protein
MPVVRLGAAFHSFSAVLLAGTIWRIASYHLMASSNPSMQHLGAAMATQY